ERIVKWVRNHSRCQAAILDAFQEEGWPSSIYDPLRPSPDIPSNRRLHNAIRKLNRGLPTIRFHADGTGRSVLWRWTRQLNQDRQTRAWRLGKRAGKASAASSVPTARNARAASLAGH